jgi:ArsR family transcriptional regulator, arsenate/arsenite/antimonite-responsive transcriptional repressor
VRRPPKQTSNRTKKAAARALTLALYLHNNGTMEKTAVLAALAALAQGTRLDIFRLLVQAGEEGIPAGKIGEQLGLPSATLTFHLKELKHAGLVTFIREGRSLIYSAVYPTMNALLGYLTENCCQGNPAACGVVATPKTSKRKVAA